MLLFILREVIVACYVMQARWKDSLTKRNVLRTKKVLQLIKTGKARNSVNKKKEMSVEKANTNAYTWENSVPGNKFSYFISFYNQGYRKRPVA